MNRVFFIIIAAIGALIFTSCGEVQSVSCGPEESETEMSREETSVRCRYVDWDWEREVKTAYEGKLTGEDCRGLMELVEKITALDPAEQDGFDLLDCRVTLKRGEETVTVETAVLEFMGVDDIGDLDVKTEPGFIITRPGEEPFCVRDGGLTKDFEEAVRAAVMKDENITDAESLARITRQEITDPYPKDLIVCIRQETDRAADKNEGVFLDSYGYIYEFDLSGRSFSSDEELMDTLYYDCYYKTSPVSRTDEGRTMDTFIDSMLISPEAGFVTDYIGISGSQSTCLWLADTEEPYLTKLSESGAFGGYIDDPAGRETARSFEELLAQGEPLED